MNASTRYFKSHAPIIGCTETFWLVDGKCIQLFRDKRGYVTVDKDHKGFGASGESEFEKNLSYAKRNNLLITSK